MRALIVPAVLFALLIAAGLLHAALHSSVVAVVLIAVSGLLAVGWIMSGAEAARRFLRRHRG